MEGGRGSNVCESVCTRVRARLRIHSVGMLGVSSARPHPWHGTQHTRCAHARGSHHAAFGARPPRPFRAPSRAIRNTTRLERLPRAAGDVGREAAAPRGADHYVAGVGVGVQVAVDEGHLGEGGLHLGLGFLGGGGVFGVCVCGCISANAAST
jgi:hypothetical protein